MSCMVFLADAINSPIFHSLLIVCVFSELIVNFLFVLMILGKAFLADAINSPIFHSLLIVCVFSELIVHFLFVLMILGKDFSSVVDLSSAT